MRDTLLSIFKKGKKKKIMLAIPAGRAEQETERNSPPDTKVSAESDVPGSEEKLTASHGGAACSSTAHGHYMEQICTCSQGRAHGAELMRPEGGTAHR